MIETDIGKRETDLEMIDIETDIEKIEIDIEKIETDIEIMIGTDTETDIATDQGNQAPSRA